jgi:hypothetical protein
VQFILKKSMEEKSKKKYGYKNITRQEGDEKNN